MNIFDSFFLLFQTNAKEATKDVQAFGKATDQTQNQINQADKSAQNLGLSFSKLALAGVAALEGFASLGKLKSGIQNAIDYNAVIERTARLTGINARELSVYNSAVAAAGGNPGGREYLNFISQLNKQYAGLGVNQRIKRVNEDLGNLAERIKKLNEASPGSGYQLAQKLGVGDDLYLALQRGREGWEQYIQTAAKFDNTTAKITQQSLELKGQWANIYSEFRSFFNDMLPLATVFTKAVMGMAGAVRVLGLGASASYHAVKALFELGLFNFHGAAKEYGKAFGNLGEAGKVGNDAADFILGKGGNGVGAGGNSSGSSSNADESRSYWKSLGYSDSQISALLANEKAESSYNPAAVGDNGQAAGIFQWHAARRARILKGTGIDVTTADHASQLRAAAWELENSGYAAKLRSTNTPGAGASVLTDFEKPANQAQQSYLRGQSADSIFSQIQRGQSLLNSADQTRTPAAQGKSVTVGTIIINSQATDANGIATDIHGALNKQLATTVGAFDDSRLA